MGAIETTMLDIACAHVGKYLGLPTHAYLVASDSKLVDAQAGRESSISAVLGALAGINMISVAGMLDSLACHSVEKLVIDAEAIASAQRLISGIATPTETLAISVFAQSGLRGDFLKLKETWALFRSEQHFPSAVIDRSAGEDAENKPLRDTFCRARTRVTDLLVSYSPPALPEVIQQNLLTIASHEAKRAGLKLLPGV
jgi:trimethylamine---corrinoid protein Co-methyltransferase